jgi:xynA
MVLSEYKNIIEVGKMKKVFFIFVSLLLCSVISVSAMDLKTSLGTKQYVNCESIDYAIKYIPDNGKELSIIANINSSNPVYISVFKDNEPVTESQQITGNKSYTYTYTSTDDKYCVLTMKIFNAAKDNTLINADITAYQNHSYSSWALNFIYEAIKYNKIPTDLQNNYSTNITREDFCRIAYQFMDDYIDKTYVESIFADTDRAEINNLANIGILKGKGKNIFAPYDNITREDAAVILERMAQKMSIMRENESFRTFDDEASVSSYAISSVQNITRLCIMEGKANNRFCPKDLLTKEEAIATFIRLSGLQN